MTQTPPSNRGMALDLVQILAETGLTEDAVPFAGHTFTARRNAGDLRHQIFRDSELSPFGVLEPHWCEYNADRWMLRVYDPAGQLVGLPSRHGADHPDGGCVHSYTNALNHLRMVAEGNVEAGL